MQNGEHDNDREAHTDPYPNLPVDSLSRPVAGSRAVGEGARGRGDGTDGAGQQDVGDEPTGPPAEHWPRRLEEWVLATPGRRMAIDVNPAERILTLHCKTEQGPMLTVRAFLGTKVHEAYGHAAHRAVAALDAASATQPKPRLVE